ncbi:MAG: hypothetical protein C4293_22035, partial [Nitrospiraceae bacterium]
GWLAIDPKGVLGEPAYEIGAVLRNPTENPVLFAIRSIIDRRVRIISHLIRTASWLGRSRKPFCQPFGPWRTASITCVV